MRFDALSEMVRREPVLALAHLPRSLRLSMVDKNTAVVSRLARGYDFMNALI